MPCVRDMTTISSLLRVLLIEDSEPDGLALVDALRTGGFEIATARVSTPDGLRRALRDGAWDVVLSKHGLAALDPLAALAILRDLSLDIPLIVIADAIAEDSAVSTLKAGAHDFVLRQNLGRLAAAVQGGRREAAAQAEQKRDQEKVIVSERMASVGLLAAGIAHEVNNPLAAVLANLQLAQEWIRDVPDRGPEGASIMEALAEAMEAAERVRQIVRDVKIFSRREESRQGPVAIHRVLDSAARMAWNDIRHRARLVKRYGSVRSVLGSEARIGQVFLNLLVNAAQAIEEGKAAENEIRIVTSMDGPDRVAVEVSDTGPGIPAEIRDRLFTPFATTKPAGVGTGLGLFICRRIVAGLGGEITVTSDGGGRGTTFRVILPATDQAPLRIETSSALAAFAAPRRGRILVIDDEALITDVVRRVLGRQHDVSVAFEAGQVLQRITAGDRFDLILCDLLMPQVTGMDLHDELKRKASDQADRMVFMSGGAFTDRATRFLEQFPERWLEKPFDRAALVAVVNEWVR